MALSWPWRFVSLAPEELEQRRELLDHRGYYAQWSVLLVTLVVRICRIGALRSEHYASNKPRSWWHSPPVQGWAETRRQYLISFIWLGWLLGLAAWNTGNGR